MPFQSEKQRRFLWAAHPEVDKRWAKDYPESNKGLPMYAPKKDDQLSDHSKAAAIAVLRSAMSNAANMTNLVNINLPLGSGVKLANSGMVKVPMPNSKQPTCAGEKPITPKQNASESADNAETPKQKDDAAVTALFGKLSAVLARPLREAIERMQAEDEARESRFVPANLGLRRYSAPSPSIMPPMGMAAAPGQPQPQAQAQAQAQPAQPANTPSNGPVGGGSNPQFNPINAFGAIGAKGQLNGNAAFGQKNSPDSLKIAGLFYRDLEQPTPMLVRDDYGAGLGAVRTQTPRMLTRLFSNPSNDIRRAIAQLGPEAGMQADKDPSQHISGLLGQQLIKNHPSRYVVPNEFEHADVFMNEMDTHPAPTTTRALAALRKEYAPMTAPYYLDDEQKRQFNMMFQAGLGDHHARPKTEKPKKKAPRGVKSAGLFDFMKARPEDTAYREHSRQLYAMYQKVQQDMAAQRKQKIAPAELAQLREQAMEPLYQKQMEFMYNNPSLFPRKNQLPTVEKISMPRGLGELPQGAGPDQIADAIMRFNQLRTLVRPTDETLKGHNLSRKGFQGSLRKITSHSQGKDKFDLHAVAPNPKLRAALTGLAGLGAAGGLAYTGNTDLALGALPATALAAGGAYLHGEHERSNVLNTARLMKQYGLLKPKLLQQAYPLLGDEYRVA